MTERNNRTLQEINDIDRALIRECGDLCVDNDEDRATLAWWIYNRYQRSRGADTTTSSAMNHIVKPSQYEHGSTGAPVHGDDDVEIDYPISDDSDESVTSPE